MQRETAGVSTRPLRALATFPPSRPSTASLGSVRVPATVPNTHTSDGTGRDGTRLTRPDPPSPEGSAEGPRRGHGEALLDPRVDRSPRAPGPQRAHRGRTVRAAHARFLTAPSVPTGAWETALRCPTTSDHDNKVGLPAGSQHEPWMLWVRDWSPTGVWERPQGRDAAPAHTRGGRGGERGRTAQARAPRGQWAATAADNCPFQPLRLAPPSGKPGGK